MKKVLKALFLAILVAIPVALYVAANYFFNKELNNTVRELGLQDSLTWEDSGISLFGRSGYITDVRYNGITIDKVTFSRFSYKKSLTMTIDGLTAPVTPAAIGRLYDPANVMGYASFHANAVIVFTLNGNMLEVASTEANITELGRPSFTLSFEAIAAERIIAAITSAMKLDKPMNTMRFNIDGVADPVQRAVNALAVSTNEKYDDAHKRVLSAINRHANAAEINKEALLQLYRLVSAPASLAVQLTTPTLPAALLPPSLAMASVEDWRYLEGWLLALPMSITAY
jgi:hypothetical protein